MLAKRKGSAYVSDEIAALFDPTPVGNFDPENDGGADDTVRIIGEGEMLSSDEGDEFESKGRRRRAGELDELEERYPSKPISRKRWEKQFAGSKPSRAPVELSEDEEAEEEDGEDGDMLEGSGEEEEGEEGKEDSEFDEDEDEDDDEDELEGGGRGARKKGAKVGGGLQAEWAQLELEEGALARKLAADGAQERVKATEAAGQHAAWEQVFNVRIMLHKALSAANQMPDPALLPDFAAHGQRARSAVAECAQSALLLLGDMLALSGALGSSAEDGGRQAREGERLAREAGAAEQAGGAEAAELVDGAWRVLQAASGAGMRAQLASLDEWSAKVGLGALPGSERKFKAFHARGIGEQVDAALADPARVAARAHTIRSGKLPLGTRAGRCALADGAEASCAHVYDDTDFYHTQLKEFVERRSVAADLDPEARKHTLKRRRREVDRKASKGRKISYEVHAKLQNFMFPVETSQPVAIAELFKHVFGSE
ncbi:apoptosis-antagonizing transcription factor [Pavlovales sp. CCMP2436]|nr:apoptosis-antagonizing transcription factor [Pavlovales sp. CCMP2436]